MSPNLFHIVDIGSATDRPVRSTDPTTLKSVMASNVSLVSSPVSSHQSTCGSSGSTMSASNAILNTSLPGILLDDERFGTGVNLLPSLTGLPVRVRAATLPVLLELVVACFSEDGELQDSACNFPQIFFLMHQWFTTSEILTAEFKRLLANGPSYYSTLTPIISNCSSSPLFSKSETCSSSSSSSDTPLKSLKSSSTLVRSSDPLPRSRTNLVLVPRPARVGSEDDAYSSFTAASRHSLSHTPAPLFSESVSQPLQEELGQDLLPMEHKKTRNCASAEIQASGWTSVPLRRQQKVESQETPNIRLSRRPTAESNNVVTNTEKSTSDPPVREEVRIVCKSDCCHRADKEYCALYRYRRQICHALRFWIFHFPVHFDMDPRLAAFMVDLKSQLTDGSHSYLANLIDLSCLPSYDWIRNISVRDPSIKHCRKVSLVFNHLEPCELGEHLTFLEHRIMRRITFQDYKQYAVTGSLTDNPRLERSVALFNGLTQWVQCMVLSRSTPHQRAEVIVKLTDVAKKLKELRNFNSLMAMVGGLSHSSLARLSRTAACVPADSQRTLAELTEFLSSSSNFSSYRRALHECKGFKIPILGIHMKDLISLHVALSDAVEGAWINFRKMAQLSLIFQELQELQNATPPLGANVELVNTLRVSLDLAYTEDEIYELSLAREPRNSFSPQSSPTRPSLLHDWPNGHSLPSSPVQVASAGSGSLFVNPGAPLPSPPSTGPSKTHDAATRSASLPLGRTAPLPPSLSTNSQTRQNSLNTEATKAGYLETHVTAMLDAVFHSRTKLKDMATGSKELRSFAFPHQDIVAKHDFQDAVFLKPTFCGHCAGLLWGPLRQGYRCKDCSLSIHKLCKDMLNHDCHPRPPSTSSLIELLQGGSVRSRFRRRKKLTQTETVDSSQDTESQDCCCQDFLCPTPCKSCDQIQTDSEGLSPPICRKETKGNGTITMPMKLDLPIGEALGVPLRRSSSSVMGSLGQGRAHMSSPKRRSMFCTSPLPIRPRKCSLSATGNCRSFPGSEAVRSELDDEPSLRISISASPRRKVKDTFAVFSSRGSCVCQGHRKEKS